MTDEDDSGGKDLYAVLGIPRGATDEEVRAAFKALAIEAHPDKHAGDPKAIVRFKRLNAAYQVLRDPAKREQYDLLTAPIDDPGTELARRVHRATPISDAPVREVRRRKVRVRKAWRPTPWNVFAATVAGAGAIAIVAALVLERRSGIPTSHAETSSGPAPAAQPATAADELRTSLDDTRPLTPRSVTAPVAPITGATAGGGASAAAEGPGPTLRTVTGDHWQFDVPVGWQDVTSQGAHDKAAAWQAKDDVAGLRPAVKLAVKPVTGEASDYFKDVDRKLPRGTTLESEAWEDESKPDGLRREGRIAFADAPTARFIEYAVVTRGKAFELTCTAPDDATSAEALCEPILGSLRIK